MDDEYARFTLDELADLHGRAMWECSERQRGPVYGAFFRLAEALDAAHAVLYRAQADVPVDDLTAGLKARLAQDPGASKAPRNTPKVAFKVRPKSAKRACPECGGLMWKTELGWECNRGHQTQ